MLLVALVMLAKAALQISVVMLAFLLHYDNLRSASPAGDVDSVDQMTLLLWAVVVAMAGSSGKCRPRTPMYFSRESPSTHPTFMQVQQHSTRLFQRPSR